MSHVTTHLEDESGIQYSGVEDKTNLQQIGDMSNMLMLVENVPRGRLDQAMTITKTNISALLGREKGNLYLQAVEDALDAGAPSMQVMRVNGSGGCEPKDLYISRDIPNKPNVELHIDYKINNQPIQRFTYTPMLEAPPTVNYANTIFTQLVEEIASLNGEYIVTGGGGLAYFQTVRQGSLAGAGLDQVEQPDPFNITLYSVKNQLNDPIQLLFGETEVSAHSCGKKYWEGL